VENEKPHRASHINQELREHFPFSNAHSETVDLPDTTEKNLFYNRALSSVSQQSTAVFLLEPERTMGWKPYRVQYS